MIQRESNIERQDYVAFCPSVKITGRVFAQTVKYTKFRNNDPACSRNLLMYFVWEMLHYSKVLTFLFFKSVRSHD